MDTSKNNRYEKGEGSKAVCSVGNSTLDDALVCDNSKYDSTEDNSSKDSSTNESSKASSSKENNKASSSKENNKASSSKENSKANSSKENSKGSSTKQSSKGSSTKQSSKGSSTKESSKASSKEESGKSSSTKASTKESSAKDDDGNLHLVMEDDSQDHSIEEDSIGESIEEIAEEVADEFQGEEGEAEADWPAEPHYINSPDSPGEESPIHGPPAVELIVHEAASEGIVAPEDVVVFEPVVSVAVEVVHVVSVPVPVEELQPAPIVAQEHSSDNPSVPVQEQQQDSNEAQQPSSAIPSVPVREQQQDSNGAQQPLSAKPSVPVREQQQASNEAQQTPSVNQNVAQQYPAVRLPEQQSTNPQPGSLGTQPPSPFDCVNSDLWLSEAQWLPAAASLEESNLRMINAFHNSSRLLLNTTLTRQPTPEPGPVQLVRFSVTRPSLWQEMDPHNPNLNLIWQTIPSATDYGTPSSEQTSRPSREQTIPVIEQTSRSGRGDEDRAASEPGLDYTTVLAASVICGAIGITLLAVARYLNWR